MLSQRNSDVQQALFCVCKDCFNLADTNNLCVVCVKQRCPGSNGECLAESVAEEVENPSVNNDVITNKVLKFYGFLPEDNWISLRERLRRQGVDIYVESPGAQASDVYIAKADYEKAVRLERGLKGLAKIKNPGNKLIHVLAWDEIICDDCLDFVRDDCETDTERKSIPLKYKRCDLDECNCACERCGNSVAEDKVKNPAVSYGAKTGPHSAKKRFKPWIKRKGDLGEGFLKTMTESQRAKALDRAVKKFGYRPVLGKINALERSRALKTKYGAQLESAREYLKSKYGGKGSFGPRRRTSKQKSKAAVNRNRNKRNREATVAIMKAHSKARVARRKVKRKANRKIRK